MKVILIAAMFAATPTFAASSLDTMQLASALGGVIASEEPCGLSYDQGAIEAYIEKNVAADDMRFPGMLDMMVSGKSVSIADMKTSAKTAHCAQIRRIAKSYGFTK